VRATTLERTLVDVLDAPRHGGGWEEIWRSLESVVFFDLDTVADYALKLRSATTAARVGFYLEQHREALMVEEKHLLPLGRSGYRRPLEEMLLPWACDIFLSSPQTRIHFSDSFRDREMISASDLPESFFAIRLRRARIHSTDRGRGSGLFMDHLPGRDHVDHGISKLHAEGLNPSTLERVHHVLEVPGDHRRHLVDDANG
jgi:hypothetical protein